MRARVIGKARRERVAVAVALVGALTGGGGVAVADDEPAVVPGRIGYADGALRLGADESVARDGGASAPVLRLPGAAPGWDTTGVPAGLVDQETVRWSLTGLDGPGDLRVYADDGTGALLFDSADGLPDGYELPVGEAGATRWEFTAEGTYQAVFGVEAMTVDGRELSTGGVYSVLVGEEETAEAAVEAVPEAPSLRAAAPSPTASASRSAVPLSAPAAVRAEAPVVSTPKVIDEGHVDIAARVVDRRMQIHVKDGTVSGKTTWREPSSVVLHVRPAARNTLPDSDDFAFLGDPGDPVWLLDQVQQDGLLWPGWSTDNIDAGVTKGGVTFSLTDVKGPGTVALYTYDAMSGATVLFNSGDGVPDGFDVPANTHAHGGWAFTAEGTYRLTVRMSGKLADGTAVSDTETLTFVVGDEDPGAVEPGGGSGGASSAPGSVASGDGGSPAAAPADGSMASTGAGDAPLVGGVAAALAALGAVFVTVARRRRGRGRTAGRSPA
ncbi:choice-of-anchor M domain-containing protein [Streptomyces flavalbus]|uniref:Choice-of-anchor M domain-containing protein n=1 Tax=Streptomyces flavalbus TaxID=2665155 RepID=A0ABW2WAW7_9ACTN